MPTDRQIARLYALATKAGLSHADTRAELQERYGVASSKDLLPHQYEQVCTDLQRRLRPTEGQPRDGAYAAPDHLVEYARGLQQFGTIWRGRMTDDDVRLMTILLNDFRLYRTRDRRMSQRQLDQFIRSLARFDITIFRRASEVWLTHYRTGKNERYFLGICLHIQRDDASRRAGLQTTLELV